MFKIWFEKSYTFYEDENIKFSINWYKHSPNYTYKGFTIYITVFDHLFEMDFVSNYKVYKEIMGKR